MPQQDTASREAAQIAFVDYINKNAKAVPLLVARFIARQVANETEKLMPNAGGVQPPSDIPEAESGEYTMYDHIERLRYLEIEVPEEEIKIVSQILSSALPGLEQFVTEERHATLLGKMAYNAYGVCFRGGRDDKVCLQLKIVLECHSCSDCSLIPRNDRKTWKRHERRTELPNKSVVVYISFQHMYVPVTQSIPPSDTFSPRLPILVLHPPAHPSITEHLNFTSLPITLSRRATRLPYLTLIAPNTLTKRPLMPGDAAVWNWPVVGGLRAHAHGAHQMLLRILPARMGNLFRMMSRGSRNRLAGLRRTRVLLHL
jgi:hypothetical protein